MFKWWKDSPEGAKLICETCGFGYAKDEEIIKGDYLECPKCFKKDKFEMKIVHIGNE